ncbi:MAG: SpoIIE family protein phosphatase [Desulfobacteraceae bacterium]|nr:SpoIIE family protein phosphatase [Desulfobacteraceae bacterium]
MPKFRQQRVHERVEQEVPIMFTCSPGQPFCFYGATLRNHSLGGVYFETRYAMEPGSVLHFNRALGDLTDGSPDGYRTHRVQVRWCREIQDAAQKRYGIGAQFLDLPSEPTDTDADDLAVCPEPQTGNGAGFGLKDAAAGDIAASRAERLCVLNRFAVHVSSSLDLKEILQSVCREMTYLFDARNTGIGLLNRDRSKITIVAFFAADPEEPDATGIDVPLKGNAATHRVVETGQTMVVPDVQHNPLTRSIHEIAKQRGTECLMIVPLMSRGEVIGTIGMPTATPDRIFSMEDVALAQTIASQIASAIDNARLFARTERARERAEHELEIGRRLQSDFLPDRLPRMEGWELTAHFEPARKVSGDFYDAFSVGRGDQVGLIVGDVCDHGVGSALYMVLFRSLMRTHAASAFENVTGDSEASIGRAMLATIGRTNDYIAGTHGLSGMFATLFWSVLDPAAGRLLYINGGHVAPVLIGRNIEPTRLHYTGPAVGVTEGTAFAVERVRMEPGQILFGYTDGVVDAQSPDGESFGERRMAEILAKAPHSASGLMQQVLRRLKTHTLGSEAYDDLTMLVLRRAE